jgi:hypothetical protein
MEPTIGVEPMNLFLTKEALYRLSYVGYTCSNKKNNLMAGQRKLCLISMERETRLELATFSLEG